MKYINTHFVRLGITITIIIIIMCYFVKPPRRGVVVIGNGDDEIYAKLKKGVDYSIYYKQGPNGISMNNPTVIVESVIGEELFVGTVKYSYWLLLDDSRRVYLAVDNKNEYTFAITENQSVIINTEEEQRSSVGSTLYMEYVYYSLFPKDAIDVISNQKQQ